MMASVRFAWVCCGVGLLSLAPGRASAAPDTPAAPADARRDQAAGEVGREGRRIESQVLNGPLPNLDVHAPPPVAVDAVPTAQNLDRLFAGRAELAVRWVRFAGDTNLLAHLQLDGALARELCARPLTREALRDLLVRHRRTLARAGFPLASLQPLALAEGELTLYVDGGRIGRIRFLETRAGRTAPYRGRWFSEDQLRHKLAGLQEGDLYEYAIFRKCLGEFNSDPDLRADVDIRIRTEAAAAGERRFADLDFTVRESAPYHVILDLHNSGSEFSSDWSGGLTLQLRNLTGADDALTISAPFSLDLETTRSVAASYAHPIQAGRGGMASLYGGYSTIDSEDVLPDIDVQGRGWFAGLQLSHRLLPAQRHQLSVAYGMEYQYVADELLLGGTGVQERDIRLIPVVLGLNYAALTPDRLGGRSFLAAQSAFHHSGFLGASEDEDMDLQREDADGTFVVLRLQAARLQPLGATGPDARPGWSLFLRADAQLTDEPLIPAQQMSLGGLGSVRGFRDATVLGDEGACGSVELRTPVAAALCPVPFRGGRFALQWQGVLFYDAGYAAYREDMSGLADRQSLSGAGAGVRCAVGRRLELRVDYGVPVEKADADQEDGFTHVTAQLQF